MGVSVKGAAALETLAMSFPQLYVAPAEDAQDAHRLASTRGVAPESANLAHFVTSKEDELREVDTLAGPVNVLFLKERADFETFLQIIGHKSSPVPIARTVGAITYRGLADWGKVAAARVAYLAEGGDDWPSEFARLAKQPGMFRAELVVISEDPYSNVGADETSYGDAEWLCVSREIRLHHECAHVVCRRTMPENVLPVWDEVTADVAGLLCATGRYDAVLAAKFLGIAPEGFVGGRLSEYLDDDQKARIDEIALEVGATLGCVEELSRDGGADDPFGFVIALKEDPLIGY